MTAGGQYSRELNRAMGVALACLVLIALLLGWWSVKYVALFFRVTLAEEQTKIFEDLRVQALQSPPEKAVEYLGGVVHYYPSGSKQVTGSRLDRIVEQARQSAVREILADLRARTGKDFGDDPQRWIDELAPRRD